MQLLEWGNDDFRRAIVLPTWKLWCGWCGLFVLVSALSVARGVPAEQVEAELAEGPLASQWVERDFWSTPDGKPVSEGWQFANGEVSLVTPRQGGNIVSRPLPPNFELSWQWKIEKGVNSGLKYRVRTFGAGALARTLGLEYQIIDSAPDDTSLGSTGAIYDLVAPCQDKVLHPPGQWNTAKVVAIGDRIEHYLNGQLVTSASTAGAAWDTTVALSKFLGADDFGRPREGDRVMLTDHGGKVVYKDFQFVPHAAPAAAPTVAVGPFLANGSRNSWVDQNSIVIWTRTTRMQEMLAEGMPFVRLTSKQAKQLEAERDPAKLQAAQLPTGATLDEMLGACPGAGGRVRLSYYPEHQRRLMRQTPWVLTQEESDYTAQWKLEGLAAGKRYLTIIEAQSVEGEPTAVAVGSFQTAFPVDAAQPFTFCVTTCHDFIRRDDGSRGHKIYTAMPQQSPAFVVHAGDIEYYDKPDPWALTKDLMRFKWGRIFSLPANRSFYSSTSSYFIKDDHDTLANDCWPGQTYGSVTFAEGVQLFNEEQFPTRSPRYATVRWGRDLQIWLLEGRDYRSPHTMPDGPEKTILGSEQKAWLSQTLAASDAAFKLVFSPTPVVGPDRDNKQDNHANEIFAWEGQQLRELFAATPGVIVCCGWTAGEQRASHRWRRGAGGYVSGELGYPGGQRGAVLTLRHHAVDGQPLNKFDFNAVPSKAGDSR